MEECPTISLPQNFLATYTVIVARLLLFKLCMLIEMSFVMEEKYLVWAVVVVAVTAGTILAILKLRKLSTIQDESKQQKLYWLINQIYWVSVRTGYKLTQYITDTNPSSEGGWKRIMEWVAVMCGILLAPKIVQSEFSMKVFAYCLCGCAVLTTLLIGFLVEDGGNTRRLLYMNCGLAIGGLLCETKLTKKRKEKYVIFWICYGIVSAVMLIVALLLDPKDEPRGNVLTYFAFAGLGTIMGTLIRS